MKKSNLATRGVVLIALFATVSLGCSQDDVKIIDVPRKDIPKEVLNRPIPPEAFKTMRPAARQQMKKMEQAVQKLDAEKGPQ